MSDMLWVIVVLAALLVVYLLYMGGVWLYERLILSAEERWRRRYDRGLKRQYRE